MLNSRYVDRQCSQVIDTNGMLQQHRDLHLGNICIQTAQGAEIKRPMGISTSDVAKKFGLSKIKATLIDYTLSRATIEESDNSEAVAYLDLENDPELFEGEGLYQYEVYRL